MSTSRYVAVFVGSLRKEAFSRKIANALIAEAPATLKLAIHEIGQLPLYNADYEADPPAVVIEFKQRLAAADAVLFVTPEYNRGVPGALKNAIDVGSRPYGKSAWEGKPGAIVSISPGAIGDGPPKLAALCTPNGSMAGVGPGGAGGADLAGSCQTMELRASDTYKFPCVS